MKYVKIDETRNWVPRFLEKNSIVRMVGVYVFDETARTHCCEATPSYWLEFIETQPEGGPEDEDARAAMYEDILQNEDVSDNNSHYAHCADIHVRYCDIIEIGDLDGCEDMEEAREYAQANSL